MNTANRRERGSTLIISLVFLLVFLVMALSIFRGSLTSSQAIGNMQWRNEAISAANEVIDRLLSSADVVTKPGNVVQAQTWNPDVNYDNKADFLVTLPAAPACIRVQPIPPTALSPDREEDAGCFASSSAGGIAVEGTVGASPATGPASLCANSEWSVTVRVADAAGVNTGTSVEVVQGFAVRVPTVSIPAGCE